MMREAPATDPLVPSPLAGEGRGPPPKAVGRVRGQRPRDAYPADAIVRARRLRKEAGEPERILWRALREALPEAKFRRQVPLGPYHADFCSHRAKLVVEVDGDDHVLRAEADIARTRFLDAEGYRVIRFANSDVVGNVESIVTMIANALAHARKGHP